MCPLAPDAAAPPPSDSPRALGPRGGVDRGGPAVARGQTVTVAPGGPQKADRHPARGAHGDASPLLGLCGSAARPCPGAGHPQDAARAVPRRWHPAVPPRSRGDVAAGRRGTRLCGGRRLLPPTPPRRPLLSTAPLAFLPGIAGLRAACRPWLGGHPLE